MIASGVAGCSSGSDDGKKVAGRTRSLATAAEPDQATPEARVRLRRTTAQATGVEAASLSATLRAKGATAAILLLPGGEELTLAEEDVGVFGVELTDTPEQLDARCPDGAYTFASRLVDGSLSTVTVMVGGAAPMTPTIVAPGDLAVVQPDALAVTWSWPGTAALFDVTLIDVTTGEVAYRRRDLAGRDHLVPAGAVASARRYRLEIAAASASDAAPVRFEAAATIEVDVSSGGAP